MPSTCFELLHLFICMQCAKIKNTGIISMCSHVRLLYPVFCFRKKNSAKMLKAVLKKSRDGGKANKKESGRIFYFI